MKLNKLSSHSRETTSTAQQTNGQTTLLHSRVQLALLFARPTHPSAAEDEIALTIVFSILAILTAVLVIASLLHKKPADPYSRGRFLLSFKQAHKKARTIRPRRDHGLPWGGVQLPSESRHTHFAVFGRTGAGKTILQRVLQQSVLPHIGIAPDRRAVVYDPKLDFVSILHGMGLRCPIIILCPFDLRCASWDIAADCTDIAAAMEIGLILIPEEEGHNRYFPDAARDLLQGVLVSFLTTTPGVWTLRDIVHAMTNPGYLRQIVARSPHTHRLLSYFEKASNFASVQTTINTKMAPLAVVAACWSRAAQTVSLQAWQQGQFILVLGNHEKLRGTLDTLYRILFKRISEVILAADNSPTRQTWLFLDEVRETKKMDGLSRLLTQGRSKGVSVVLGAQGIEGIRDAFGDKAGEELVTQCSQFTFLGLNSPATADWASKLLGQYERREHRESVTRDHTSHTQENQTTYTDKDQTTSAEQIVSRKTVLPAELLSLPSANPKNGIHGYHISPDVGAWFAKIPGRWVNRNCCPPHPGVPNHVPRPASHQYLLPWDEHDLARLHLEPLPDQPAAPQSHEADTHEARRLRIVTPASSLATPT